MIQLGFPIRQCLRQRLLCYFFIGRWQGRRKSKYEGYIIEMAKLVCWSCRISPDNDIKLLHPGRASPWWGGGGINNLSAGFFPFSSPIGQSSQQHIRSSTLLGCVTWSLHASTAISNYPGHKYVNSSCQQFNHNNSLSHFKDCSGQRKRANE